MPSFIEMLKLKPVKGYLSGHGNNPTTALPEQLVGLELEIENFDGEHEFGGFTFTEDGSLRNYGIEAISKPVQVQQVEALLRAFYKHFRITQENNYSERCSLHVHMDMQSRTPEELATIFLVYQTVERLLFKFIGHQRDESIFCVPWSQSNINYNLVMNMLIAAGSTVRSWQKYSALNILPMASQGTIEFRHLHGTCDVLLIMTWINMLCRMVKYGMSNTLEDTKKELLEMNTISNYRGWLERVFGAEAEHLLSIRGYEIDLERGVIDSKYMLMDKVKVKSGINTLQDYLNEYATPVYPANMWATTEYTGSTAATIEQMLNQTGNLVQETTTTLRPALSTIRTRT